MNFRRLTLNSLFNSALRIRLPKRSSKVLSNQTHGQCLVVVAALVAVAFIKAKLSGCKIHPRLVLRLYA